MMGLFPKHDGPRFVGICPIPPKGWYCTRTPGHEGPCAAVKMPRMTIREWLLEHCWGEWCNRYLPEPIRFAYWNILTGQKHRVRRDPKDENL